MNASTTIGQCRGALKVTWMINRYDVWSFQLITDLLVPEKQGIPLSWVSTSRPWLEQRDSLIVMRRRSFRPLEPKTNRV